MLHRNLFLAAYDVSDPRRLRLALKVLRNYATGGQKSVFECYLTPAERQALLAEVAGVIDPEDDRFILLRLDPRSKVRTLGIAVKPADPAFFYVG
jgi:CRISPR-associated protein Cas2